MDLWHEDTTNQPNPGALTDGLPRHSITRRNRLGKNSNIAPILSNTDVEIAKEFFEAKKSPNNQKPQ